MPRYSFWLFVGLLSLLLPALADAQGFSSARVYGIAQGPYGWYNFCNRTPDECRKSPVSHEKLETTPLRLQQLDEVHRWVNTNIQPVSDMVLYGKEEYWTLPYKMEGDCEDYALLKRHLLMSIGWPASALLITVVTDAAGEGHAVLMARLSSGDYILDNARSQISIWYQMPYQKWVMRQSYLDPMVWLSLVPPVATSSTR